MIKFYSLLQLECDPEENKKRKSKFCWKDILIYVAEGETKEQAFEYVNRLGWELVDDTCLCPYCSAGLKKEDYKPVNLELLKNE